MSAGFAAGVRAALRGLRRSAASRDVRRTYARVVLAILAIAVAIDVAGVWIVLSWTEPQPFAQWWVELGLLALRAAGIAIVLLAAPVAALFVVNVLLPAVGGELFLAGLRPLDAERAVRLAAADGLPLWRSVGYNLVRLLQFVLLSLFALAVSFVPFVGVVAGPALQAWLTARALGWELLDPYFDKRRMRFAEQAEYVRRHRAAIVGFAWPFALLFAVPFVGPLAFGLAQASAATLLAEVLEPGEPERRI